ncbi:MAG: hypothetical protein Q9227_001503 [Pyrenula ochraceoflavens]
MAAEAAHHHGIDVSWLHHSNRDHSVRPKISSPSQIEGDPAPPISSQGEKLAGNNHEKKVEQTAASHMDGKLGSPAPTSVESQPTTPPSSKNPLKRPYLRSRASNGSIGKGTGEEDEQNNSQTGSQPVKGPQRRTSWISNLSSKFSTTTPPASPNPGKDHPNNVKRGATSPKVELHNPFGAPYQPTVKEEEAKNESPTPAASTSPKSSHPSFLQSALRKLSSSGGAGLGKLTGSGAPCPRRVMNVDPHRERSRVPEFDQAKLRRVSFCVDVEIAGFSKYPEAEADAPDPTSERRPSLSMLEQQVKINKKKDAKEARVKDVGEGAALKNPDAVTMEKETEGVVQANAEVVGTGEDFKPEGEVQGDGEPVSTKKKEKKKRTEAERKERKERKRRQAEANGDVPLELTRDDEDSSSAGTPSTGSSRPTKSRMADRPTTDPLRIYKRCAQLRETTVIKKVCEQISAPSCILAESPGTVALLDLSGLTMQLQDITTLGDWLAVVPVRKLILENCGLTDEGVRIILSGLLSCKTSEQARHNRKLAKDKNSSQNGEEKLGAIEKLCLKNNRKLTFIGWRHIGLFMHMSKSLKAIDLSGIPFPPPRTENGAKVGICILLSKGLAQCYGRGTLEELILSQCSLSAANIGNIIDGAIACGLKRLGLADNNMDEVGRDHVIRFVESGVCEGLDLGGNDFHGRLKPFADKIDERNPLFALSFADCNLDPSDLSILLPNFLQLPNFKFVDFSHNRGLFATQPDALTLLRRYLPQMAVLKRIHLADVGMSPEHLIALAEVFPEMPALAHVSVLENPKIQEVLTTKDATSQEEACALLASLMTAVRVSKSIVAMEIEVPSNESSEVVKSLASQVVAYSLRNMERGPVTEAVGETQAEDEEHPPDILLHLVGHMEGYNDNHDSDEPAPGEDYVLGGTGIVKALGVCLGTADRSRAASREESPSNSGAATPQQKPTRELVHKKPRDVSKQLLDSARKIRMRLRPALIREDKRGNVTEYRKLYFLDSTLHKMIQRFEDEYPEARIAPPAPPSNSDAAETSSVHSSQIDTSVLSTSVEEPLTKVTSEGSNDDEHLLKLSRTSSNTSLHDRALRSEEGKMHRFGQKIRRDILRPQALDYAHGTTGEEPEAEHLTLLREKLDMMRGEEIRDKVIRLGPDAVLEDMGANAEELAQLQKEDPDAFERFKESQLAMRLNQRLGADEPDVEDPASDD